MLYILTFHAALNSFPHHCVQLFNSSNVMDLDEVSTHKMYEE